MSAGRIENLRAIQAASLQPLLEEEQRNWLSRLHWDFGASAELVRRYVNVHALDGLVLIRGADVVGYCYWVTEEHKALIGDLYVRDAWRGADSQGQLLDEAIHNAAPHGQPAGAGHPARRKPAHATGQSGAARVGAEAAPAGVSARVHAGPAGATGALARGVVRRRGPAGELGAGVDGLDRGAGGGGLSGPRRQPDQRPVPQPRGRGALPAQHRPFPRLRRVSIRRQFGGHRRDTAICWAA